MSAGFRLIDLETWPRREHYEAYFKNTPCTWSMTVQLDVTGLVKQGAKLYPGIEQMLADLKKEYFLAIVSNCQCGYIEAFLEHYGFGKYIDDIQCFGMNEVPKGENIRLVAERNHLEDAVYVGDIQGDYDASKAAGVKFIHAAYGFGEIEDEVPRIEKPLELKEVIQKIWS